MIQRERRKARRFLIQLPLIVRWKDESLIGEAHTQTQDVSSCGLRFDLPTVPKSGPAVEILMTLPHQMTHAGPVRVNCKGRIVRISLKGDNVEVAAAIDRFKFIWRSENAA